MSAIVVLIAMWVVCLSGLSRAALRAAQWQLFALAGFHWLWDFVLFATPLAGEQIHASVSTLAPLNLPIEIIVGIVLCLRIKQVPERAIALRATKSFADFPQAIHF